MCVRASFSGAVAINPLQLYYIILYLFKGQAHEPFYQTKKRKRNLMSSLFSSLFPSFKPVEFKDSTQKITGSNQLRSNLVLIES